ncbi:hypothetical protein ACIFUY_06435 [Streptomyces sp. CACIS-1.16CA]|uniref:hypothetical protein n=1 Tax=Streptomyces sp. CACIS-1.16CA TaxID=1175510 RepID=UPI0037CF5DFD
MADDPQEADVPTGVMAKDLWERFRELHTEGLGRNAIAREMGKCGAVVSRTAEHLGLTFDRSRIEAATAARVADLAERRSLLAVQFTDVAEESLQKIHEPTTVYAFGGKENNFNSETFPEAPHAERRILIMAAGAAIDRSLKLAPPEQASGGADEAKSMLGKLAQGISALVNEDAETPPEGEL